MQEVTTTKDEAGGPVPDEKAKQLQGLLRVVRDGVRHHPRADDLRQLAADLEQEYLLLAVPDDQQTTGRDAVDSEGTAE